MANLDKVLVITGASSGIGAAVAERAAARGARVVLAARRERELRAVAARCGADALPVATDVTQRASVQRLMDAALERFGQVDVWINNAGRGISRAVAQLTDADLDEMVAVNVKSVVYGIQAVLPHFKERRRGQIVTVSSMLGRVPFYAPRSAYSAAKHAVNALVACLRSDLAAEFPEIQVTLVSPGVVATDFGLHALGGGPDSRSLPNAQPVEDVADVILDTIERPQADVYTLPGMKERVVAYYGAEDMAAALGSPFGARR